MAGAGWSEAEEAWLRGNPSGDHASFLAAGFARSYDAFRFKRKRMFAEAPRPAPPVWDKREADFHWTDVLAPAATMQELAGLAKSSQDHGRIAIASDKPVPVLFISDWHVGSWGVSYRRVAEMTQTIKDLGLRVAVLGDMLQMSVKLRNVLEVSDNLLPPALQMRFLESWLEDLAPHILWATWDNHSVMREEQAVGFSRYAELFKDKTIYHSGIGHIDLTVGRETYKIASAHRFRGNSIHNPTHGQSRYLRMEGVDREVAVAGDSHRPATASYFDGPLQRFAINCGTLQTDSGYAKRFFSLYTHDAFPVLVFWPDAHRIVPFWTLDHYLAVRAMDKEAA